MREVMVGLVLLATAGLVGCGDDDATPLPVDAGEMDAARAMGDGGGGTDASRDAGAVMVDAGDVMVDAGDVMVDAGDVTADAGGEAADAGGAAADAGGAAADAGGAAADAGSGSACTLGGAPCAGALVCCPITSTCTTRADCTARVDGGTLDLCAGVTCSGAGMECCALTGRCYASACLACCMIPPP